MEYYLLRLVRNVLFTFITTVLCRTSANAAIRGMNFFILKDVKPDGGNLLEGVGHFRTRWFCLSACEANSSCGSVFWRSASGECGLMAEYKSELLFIAEQGTNVYSKIPCRRFPLYDKSSWNPSPRSGTPGNLDVPVSYVVIHHTALSRNDGWPGDCGDLSSCFQALRDIQYYDMNSRSKTWADIGVNFFLDGSGRIYEGRGWSTNGAYLSVTSRGGTQGYGKHVAITLFGDFRNNAPTVEARVSLRAFCACAIENGYLTRQYTVLGHVEDKSFTSYVCPGQAMLDMLHKWPLI